MSKDFDVDFLEQFGNMTLREAGLMEVILKRGLSSLVNEDPEGHNGDGSRFDRLESAVEDLQVVVTKFPSEIAAAMAPFQAESQRRFRVFSERHERRRTPDV